MSYVSYGKIGTSDFYDSVSGEDKLQDINLTKVNISLQKLIKASGKYFHRADCSL